MFDLEGKKYGILISEYLTQNILLEAEKALLKKNVIT